jgi:hypothetical protein
MAATQKKEKKPILTGASSRHITNLQESILEIFDIYASNIVNSGSVNETLTTFSKQIANRKQKAVSQQKIVGLTNSQSSKACLVSDVSWSVCHLRKINAYLNACWSGAVFTTLYVLRDLLMIPIG